MYVCLQIEIYMYVFSKIFYYQYLFIVNSFNITKDLISINVHKGKSIFVKQSLSASQLVS